MQLSHVKTEFNQLPYEAQLERLSALARRAITHYGLDDATVSLLNYTNNAVFKVEAQSGVMILRLYRAGLRPLTAIQSELMWLSELAEKGVHVPAPIGEIYTGELEHEASPVYCTLTTRLEGEPLTYAQMTDDHIRAIGRFIGQLHTIASGFTPSADFSRSRLDYEGLFGDDSPYNPKDGASIFTDEQKAVMEQVQTRVKATFDYLGQTADTFGLIHADFIPQNMVWDGMKLGAIDFEYCGYGYYLYDLAPMLWMNRNEPNYDHLRLMLWDGYNEIRPQPKNWMNTLPTFVAARHVASCRWIAGNLSNPSVRARAHQVIAERVEEMKSFLMQPNDLIKGE
ncbi:MAG: phosphotransferase [Anaerolineae bacterium]|nr:phosphotransferase [Anaerolineae bacterium]